MAHSPCVRVGGVSEEIESVSIHRPKKGEQRFCRDCESNVVQKPYNRCWQCMAAKWYREQRARYRGQRKGGS